MVRLAAKVPLAPRLRPLQRLDVAHLEPTREPSGQGVGAILKGEGRKFMSNTSEEAQERVAELLEEHKDLFLPRRSRRC
jgi:hypothetical protein